MLTQEVPVSRMSLTGGAIVTMDEAGTVLPRGTVVIEDGQIVEVVPHEVRHGTVVDCRGRLVTPGFVNCHAHGLEALFRGAGGELPLVRWIRERSHPLLGALDEDGARAAVRLVTMEMISTGTTAWLDPEVPPQLRVAIALAAAESGIRATLAVALESRAGYGHDDSHHQHHSGHGHGSHGGHDGDDGSGVATSATGVDDLVALLQPVEGAPRVRFWLGPRVLSAVTPELGEQVRSAADATSSGVTFHCAEVPEDVADTRARYGETPAGYARRIGLLSQSTVIAHGVQLEPEDFDALAATGTSVAHCPTSNARIGAGIAPVVDMTRRGVRVALGTDGGMCNDTYDMIAELRIAALIQKASRRDPSVLSPEAALAMATVGGADALGLPVGRLVPGLGADCVVFDLDRAGGWPTVDPIDTLVHAAGARAVESVILGGELVVSDGQPTWLDPERVRRDARDAAESAIQASGVGPEITPRWLAPVASA
jgi:cytosine/adenosine deaminase-related metal-dependent hydrolase